MQVPSSHPWEPPCCSDHCDLDFEPPIHWPQTMHCSWSDFTEHIMCSRFIHVPCSMGRNVLLFQECTIFHCVDHPLLTHPSNENTWGSGHTIVLMNTAVIKMCVHTCSSDPISILLGVYLKLDVEISAQRGKVPCWGSHSQCVRSQTQIVCSIRSVTSQLPMQPCLWCYSGFLWAGGGPSKVSGLLPQRSSQSWCIGTVSGETQERCCRIQSRASTACLVLQEAHLTLWSLLFANPVAVA